MNNNMLTYSEVVYLFGDKFLSERSSFVNKDIHPSGEKISIKPFSKMMVIAAFLYLEEKGYICLLTKEVKKMLFFSGKDVFATKKRQDTRELSGIEKALLNNIGDETKIRDAVYNLLRENETSPWGIIINISKKSLVEKGFLNEEVKRKFIVVSKKYYFNEKKIKEVESLYERVRELIGKFSLKVDTYKLVESGVLKGMATRVEHSSSDD